MSQSPQQPADADRQSHYQPFVLIVAAVCTGIGLDRWLSVPVTWSTVLAVVAFGSWLVIRSLKSANGWRTLLGSGVLLLAYLCLAMVWHHGRWHWFGENEIGRFASDVAQPVCIEGRISSEPRWLAVGDDDVLNPIPKGDRTRMLFRPTRLRNGIRWQTVSGKMDLVVHDRAEQLRSGELVRVFGSLVRIKPPSNPGQFDFADFYRRQGKLATLHAYSTDAVVTQEPPDWFHAKLISSLRRELNELTWHYVSPERAGLASAILLGNREQLTRDRRDLFLMTGTVHLLAISGLHVGILAGAILLLYRVGALRRRSSLWATIGFVLFYTWLVEFRPPVSRAAILIVLYCVGRLIGLRSLSFNWLAFAGLVVVIVNPTDLFGIGPQLSFLAVATIVFGKEWMFWKPSIDPLQRLIANTRPFHVRSMYWWGRKLRAAALVSGVIWLVAMPLVAYRFNLVAPVALLINPLLLIPIALALYAGLAVMVFGGWLAPVGWVAGKCCDLNLWLIESMIGWAQQWPASHLWTSGPPLASVVAYYLGVLVFAVYPGTKLRGSRLVLLFALWMVFGWLVPDQVAKMRRGEGRTLECTFVDIGHGTSVLLELPDGRAILYDAGCIGSSDYGFQNVSSVLWHRRVDHLDAVILSHADVDHFNAVPDLCRRFSIGTVFMSPMMIEHSSAAVQRMQRELHRANVPVRELYAGLELVTSPEIQVTVLNPPVLGTAGSDNSDSIVLQVGYRGKTLLLTGDLENNGMQLLLGTNPIDCDVVMAAHHGSRNSEPVEFAEWATPDYVVISGSAKRMDPSVSASFREVGAQVFTTGIDGAITFQLGEGPVVANAWNARYR